jgi:hypothetical protein
MENLNKFAKTQPYQVIIKEQKAQESQNLKPEVVIRHFKNEDGLNRIALRSKTLGNLK